MLGCFCKKKIDYVIFHLEMNFFTFIFFLIFTRIANIGEVKTHLELSTFPQTISLHV